MSDIEQTKHDLISSINNTQSMVDYLKNQVLPKVLNELDKESSKDTEEKGEWISIPFEIEHETDAKCPYCNNKFIDAIIYNFCPCCGHPMKAKSSVDVKLI